MVYPSDARLGLQGPSIQLISISDASFKDNDTEHKKQEQQEIRICLRSLLGNRM